MKTSGTALSEALPLPGREDFGALPCGAPVERVTIAAGGVAARVISYGACLQELWAPDCTGALDDIVLGHDSLAGYLGARNYFGATIGRVANRIAGGRFMLDGAEVRLAQNEGETTLHGGPEGFDRRLWQVAEVSAEAVSLTLESPAGDQGFPGALAARVRYALAPIEGGARLAITLEAQVDAPCPVALTHHSYFAPAGARALASRPQAVHEARLTLPAARYLPVDAALIPQAPAPVIGTGFDFRSPRRLGEAAQAAGLAGFDHAFLLDGGWARLADPVSGRVIRMVTDQPSVQVYTAQHLGAVAGKGGYLYQPQDGICLEAQAWPNAVNMPPGWGAPGVILRPGARFRAEIGYELSAPPPGGVGQYLRESFAAR